MTTFRTLLVTSILAAFTIGCSADVTPTDDSIKVEAELPKIEVGEKSPDLNPQTDADIDVDTPAPGDE